MKELLILNMNEFNFGKRKAWSENEKKDWYEFLITKKHINTCLVNKGVKISGNDYEYNGRKIRICYTNQNLSNKDRGKIKRSSVGNFYTTFNGKDSKDETLITNTIKKGLKIK